MGDTQGWLTLAVSVTGLVAIPALILTIRLTIRWTRLEDRLENSVGLFTELQRQLRDDRAATDRRLRWLEENLWARTRPRMRKQPLSNRNLKACVYCWFVDMLAVDQQPAGRQGK